MAFLHDRDFPCVGAKSAAATGGIEVHRARAITSGWNDMSIHDALLEWAWRYKTDRSGLRSLVVVFDGPDDLTEEAFEQAMWDRLQSLAEKDAWRGQSYDGGVSADTSDPKFSLSFGGEAFFVVGLHPAASRPARRYKTPALVFNLHDQFEQLRLQGRYERMREAILDRDIRLAGTPNPMLARHGDASEARQYSGRAVGPEWSCPFKDPRS